MDDGGIMMSHPEYRTDAHYGIEAIWFEGENAGYAMEDALNLVGTNQPPNHGGGGDDGYGGGDGSEYLAGTYGDDFRDDKSGNQTYDGGDGYDQVNYRGGANDYSATRLEDGGVQMSHYDGGTDILYGIDGLWFNYEQAWYSMDDMVEDYADEAYY